MAVFGRKKAYCNRYCGRGQLIDKLGKELHLSRKKEIPAFLRSKPFRYGFLLFFLCMFGGMLASTVRVFLGTQSPVQAITLLWTFRIPWVTPFSTPGVPPWVLQYAYGFYSVMATSTILAVATMVLFKPRSWCVYCPMGTMTQLICKLKYAKKDGLE